ncbi:hypothetical protein [Demequina iriomotensis]|uniref:hypothetical protein n=1 Tax=Demequina iriomotensis TaxID=1536641 RepID=UPI0007816EA0|nr:hypothetical protein [Demequina iriomotensis]
MTSPSLGQAAAVRPSCAASSRVTLAEARDATARAFCAALIARERSRAALERLDEALSRWSAAAPETP